ncbi:MAG: ArsR family transcriptional regulator, partial [Paludibacter sp.]
MIRIFANYKMKKMEKVKKRYTVEQEQMARFAKALSHPV